MNEDAHISSDRFRILAVLSAKHYASPLGKDLDKIINLILAENIKSTSRIIEENNAWVPQGGERESELSLIS